MRIPAVTLLAILIATGQPVAQDGRAFEAASVKRRAFTGAVPQVSMTGLRVRRESEDTRVMLLTVSGSGARLKRAADNAPRTDDWRRSPFFQSTKAGPGATRIRELRSDRASMRQLRDYLSRQLRLAVVDRTGLTGDYTFTMEWPADPESVQPDGSPGPPPRPPTGQAPDMVGAAGIVALREQLGLSLAQGRAPLDMLVIESVHEASEN